MYPGEYEIVIMMLSDKLAVHVVRSSVGVSVWALLLPPPSYNMHYVTALPLCLWHYGFLCEICWNGFEM